MKILYFSWLKAKLQTSDETLPWSEEIADINGLVSWMRSRGPAFAEVFHNLDVIRVAVNQEYVTGNVSLSEGDEVAFFPPVTGG